MAANLAIKIMGKSRLSLWYTQVSRLHLLKDEVNKGTGVDSATLKISRGFAQIRPWHPCSGHASLRCCFGHNRIHKRASLARSYFWYVVKIYIENTVCVNVFLCAHIYNWVKVLSCTCEQLNIAVFNLWAAAVRFFLMRIKTLSLSSSLTITEPFTWRLR